MESQTHIVLSWSLKKDVSQTPRRKVGSHKDCKDMHKTRMILLYKIKNLINVKIPQKSECLLVEISDITELKTTCSGDESTAITNVNMGHK